LYPGYASHGKIVLEKETCGLEELQTNKVLVHLPGNSASFVGT